jgi:hypothetical protein
LITVHRDPGIRQEGLRKYRNNVLRKEEVVEGRIMHDFPENPIKRISWADCSSVLSKHGLAHLISP